MIGIADVRSALGAALGDGLGGIALLDDPVRQDFPRPACFLQHIRRDIRPGNVGLVTVTDDWLATLCPPLDPYRDSAAGARAALMDGALSALRGGVIRCGDRALEVNASSGGESTDRGWIDIRVSWMEPRRERAPDAPPARTVVYETFGGNG